MSAGLVVKLRPQGPWRSGPDSGARNRVDPIFHSDSLYAAVTHAMDRLGELEDWLAATARHPAGPAVRFSSCFPFYEDLGFIVPPRSVWPPLGGMPLASTKVRWKSARFIPLGLVEALLAGQVLDENHWNVDGPSECLLPAGRPGPFRTVLRSSAAVDRLSGVSERHATACVEFRPGAGLWAAIAFHDDEAHARWSGPVRGALRLLADSGFGGERSRGWGRAEEPEFIAGTLPAMILPSRRPEPVAPDGESIPQSAPPSEPAHWLLSLFTPAPEDQVDWARGHYAVVARGGRVESRAGSGQPKKIVQMVEEGSVLFASRPIQGMAPDVAPEGFAHPVFRAGFALAIPIPGQAGA